MHNLVFPGTEVKPPIGSHALFWRFVPLGK